MRMKIAENFCTELKKIEMCWRTEKGSKKTTKFSHRNWGAQSDMCVCVCVCLRNVCIYRMHVSMWSEILLQFLERDYRKKYQINSTKKETIK